MSEVTRGERLQIMLSMDELKALDDWRFSRVCRAVRPLFVSYRDGAWLPGEPKSPAPM